MTNTVLIKRSSAANAVPQAGNLQLGELAINYNDGNLFYKNTSNVVTVIASNQFVSVSGNVTGANLDTSGNVTAAGNIIGNYILGNGAFLTGITAVSSYGNANVAAYLDSGTDSSNIITTANITGGNITTSGLITATGNITGNVFIGNGAGLTSVVGSNVTGTVANATYATSADSATTAGTVTANAQPNITSVGILSSVSASGNITSGNLLTGGLVSAAGNVTGNYIIGNGSQLTGLPAGYANSDVATYLASGTDSSNIITTANITGGNITTSGLITATGNITGNVFIGNGAGLTNITGANVTGTVANATYATSAGSATTAGTVTTAAQPNITSVGILSSVSVSGNTTSGNLLTGGLISSTGNITGNAGLFNGGLSVVGNITATGNINYQSVTDLVVGDPLVYIAANNTSDIVDIGFVGSANVGGIYQHIGLVRDYTDAKWKLFGNVVAEPTTTIDWANAVYQTFVAGNVSSTGTVVSTGNITGGNVLTGGLVSATGNVQAPRFIAGSDVSVSGARFEAYEAAPGLTVGAIFPGGAVSSVANLGFLTYYNAGSVTTGIAGNSFSFFDSAGNSTISITPSSGNITIDGFTVLADAYTAGNIDVGGTLYGANTTAISVSASGNVTANYFIGDGSQLTGITSTTITNDTTTNATYYPLVANVISGSLSTAFVANTKLTFNPSTGDIGATNFNSLSDLNRKEDIETIVEAVELVMHLRGVFFRWKDNGNRSMGLIAQEVEKFLPEVVTTAQDGTKSVSYGSIIGLLVEVVKNHELRLQALEKKPARKPRTKK